MRPFFSANYQKRDPHPLDIEKILEGVKTDEWSTAAEVAKRLGISVQRANWILNGIGSRRVERRESYRPGAPGFTRTLWRKIA